MAVPGMGRLGHCFLRCMNTILSGRKKERQYKQKEVLIDNLGIQARQFFARSSILSLLHVPCYSVTMEDHRIFSISRIESSGRMIDR